MKISDGEQRAYDFMQKAKEDGDPYLVCHFSAEEDKYNGFHGGMDKLDAMIVIKQLVKDFDISSTLLHSALL